MTELMTSNVVASQSLTAHRLKHGNFNKSKSKVKTKKPLETGLKVLSLNFRLQSVCLFVTDIHLLPDKL